VRPPGAASPSAKSIQEDEIPLAAMSAGLPEVIDSNKLNFRPNIKFSRLNFFWYTPPHLGCALGSLGESLVYVKNLRAQHPLSAEM